MQFHNVRQHLRWRGPWIVFLLALRELCKPVVYWHVWHIYETDLSAGVPQPYAEPVFEIVFHSSSDDLSSIKLQILAMEELSAEEIDTRFARGDVVAIAFSSGHPVGYMWMAFSSGIELKFATYWMLRTGEALRYGSFVIPAARGRGIHSLLNSALNNYAIQHGITRTLGSVSALNPQSLSLPRHYHRAAAMTVFLAQFRRPSFTLRKSFRAPLATRFSWPGSP